MFKNFCNRLASAVAAVAMVAVAAAVVGAAMYLTGGLALPLAAVIAGKALSCAVDFAKDAVKSSSTNENRWKPPKDNDYTFTNDQREREWAPQGPGRR